VTLQLQVGSLEFGSTASYSFTRVKIPLVWFLPNQRHFTLTMPSKVHFLSHNLITLIGETWVHDLCIQFSFEHACLPPLLVLTPSFNLGKQNLINNAKQLNFGQNKQQTPN